MKLAPIILFVYNRLEHTQKTIEALKANTLANDSELFIYSDASRNEENIEKVNQVREYIRNVDGFKKVTIIEAAENKGLSKSITFGITKAVNEFGRVIVIEDDIVTSKYFLEFMNNALEEYKDDDKVGTVSGYLYPFGSVNSNFFLQQGSCWGWGTWKRSWDLYEYNGQKLLDQLNSKNLAYKFDYDKSGSFISMLEDEVAGRNSSWDIKLYATMFINDKLHYFPNHSLAINIGFDNSGTHCGEWDFYDTILYDKPVEVKRQPIEESLKNRQLMVSYLRGPQKFFEKFISKKKYGNERIINILGFNFTYQNKRKHEVAQGVNK